MLIQSLKIYYCIVLYKLILLLYICIYKSHRKLTYTSSTVSRKN